MSPSLRSRKAKVLLLGGKSKPKHSLKKLPKNSPKKLPKKLPRKPSTKYTGGSALGRIGSAFKGATNYFNPLKWGKSQKKNQ